MLETVHKEATCFCMVCLRQHSTYSILKDQRLHQLGVKKLVFNAQLDVELWLGVRPTGEAAPGAVHLSLSDLRAGVTILS